jgi:hypothetical protein
MSFLAVSQSTKCAVPSATRSRRSSRMSLCQLGDSTDSGERARSSHSSSIAASFSCKVMSFKGRFVDMKRVYTSTPGGFKFHRLTREVGQSRKCRKRVGERFRSTSRLCFRSAVGFTLRCGNSMKIFNKSSLTHCLPLFTDPIVYDPIVYTVVYIVCTSESRTAPQDHR